jgi:3-deoxy-D-manno-octulosonic-acid transferase
VSFSPALFFYRLAVAVLGPLAGLWLGARARSGKEDAGRLGERFGRYTQARPPGTLIWLHAASVGESGVALSVLEAMAARDTSLSFLISTGTRTSAELIARRAPPRTTHIYAPLDRGDSVRRFLDHWRPDLGVFVESELWPNLILAAEKRGIKLALINARMSVKTLRRWEAWSAAGKRLAKAFAFISAADARTARALKKLRGDDVSARGNLKLATPAPSIDIAMRAALLKEIGARPVWLAASTHPGEDEIVLNAHERLRAQTPNALLIIAPRHPERGGDIAGLAGNAPRRSENARIGEAAIYVADTLGELGLFYNLAPVALVAGSLAPHLKGHNPIEPAKLGAAILTGPYVESFQDLFDTLFAAGGATKVQAPHEIAAAVSILWRDAESRAAQAEAARRIAEQGADAFAHTLASLTALLPPQTQSPRAANATA